MFTWICPQCGKEVPPAYNDCPDCSKRAAPGGADAAAAPPSQQPYSQQPPQVQQAPPQGYYPPQPQAPPPQQTYYQPPPQQAQPPAPPPQQPYYQQPPQAQAQPPAPPPQQPYYQPPPQAQQAPPPGYYAPPAEPASGLNMPVWLMTILVALAVGGVLIGIIWLASGNRGSAGNGPAPIATVESPAAKPGAKTNPLQKYIEVAGVRFVTDPKNQAPMVKFLLINHSPADISGLAGNVTIWGRTQKSEEDAQGTFSFTTNLAPMESKEMSVPLNTKRKIYELADWQNITTDVQITGPAG
jgi:hypothetical protein